MEPQPTTVTAPIPVSEPLALQGCPRCARSLLLCPCYVVPSSQGMFLVLDKAQHKIWKQYHKKGKR